MKINEISPSIYDERQLKAITGVSLEQFDAILTIFNKIIIKTKKKNKQDKIKPNNGNVGKLKTSTDKLIFILYYLKCYPTFDQFGFNFNMNKSCAHTWLYKLYPIFTETLKYLNVLPETEFKTPEEMQKAFKGVGTIAIDVTERGVQRPQDKIAQTEHYSGKKKSYR